MGGKASLLLVIGFSLIFLVVGHNFGNLSTRSTINFADYYIESNAHNIAISTANMAANDFFINQTQADYNKTVTFSGGTSVIALKTTDALQNKKEITSTSIYRDHSKKVKIMLQPSKFSKFAYYSRSEGKNIWWTYSDTVWGPMHTQDHLRAYRHPVFNGKVTIKKKLKYYSNKRRDKPNFCGGFERGVDLPMPTSGISDLEAVAGAGGFKFENKDTVYLRFNGDEIDVKYSYHDDWDNEVLEDFIDGGNNGVIFAKNSVLRIQGTVKGRYSVVASGTTIGGNIFLDDDIVYSDDPRTNPNSADMLGIISQKNVWMTDNAANHDDIRIDGSIYCAKGGFGSENFEKRPASGYIHLYGGIIQDTRRAVGTGTLNNLVSGFYKKYRYDKRLMMASPPFYPGTGAFEIVSWYE